MEENIARFKKNWKNSEYTKLIRITKRNHEYIMMNRKGRQSGAGFLQYIINQHEENNNPNKDR